jgi:hypothetical protein
MDVGVHLPLADLGEGLLGSGQLRAYTRRAADLGFAMLAAYAAAGADRVLLWPVRNPLRQLDVVAEEVRPHLAR